MHDDRNPLAGPRKWLLVLLAVVVATVFLISIVKRATPTDDFVNYYTSAQLLRSHPHDMYSISRQAAAETALGSLFYFSGAHLPPEELVFVPLTFLSYRSAFAVWAALSLGLFALSAYLLKREISALNANSHYALLAFALIPLAAGLSLGQDHTLCLLLWVLAYRNAKADREFAAGLMIGLALIRYQYAVPVLLFYLLLRRWRVLAGAAASGCALLAVSLFVVGPRFISSYLGLLRFTYHSDNAIQGPSTGGMPTIRGLAAFATPGHAAIITLIGTAAMLVWALFAARRMSREQMFCFAMVVSMAIDFHAGPYELLVLLIPLTLLLERHPRLALPACFLSAVPLVGLYLHQRLFSFFYSTFALVLMAWAVWMAWHTRRDTETAAVPVTQLGL